MLQSENDEEKMSSPLSTAGQGEIHFESPLRELIMASYSQQSSQDSPTLWDLMSHFRQSFTTNNHESILDFFSSDSSSDWEEGLAVIESILMPESTASQALSESQIQGLRKVQQLLWGGSAKAKEAHIPKELLQATPEPGSTSDYILAQFAGIKHVNAKHRLLGVIHARQFIHRLHLQTSSSRRLKMADREAYVLPEWSLLNHLEQVQVAKLLSWDQLQQWDFDIFELDRVTKGRPLLFMGWAILASPYSQFVMDQTILLESHQDHVETTNYNIDDLKGYGYTDTFKIPQDYLANFLRQVEHQYLSENPYHNNIHAADVLQSLHAILQGMNAKMLATADIEILSLLLAAVVHDMGHPGKNNAFQIHSHSDLAIQYNDVSVLENMHVSLAFKLLLGCNQQPDLNIFYGMSDEQISSVRKMIVESVLDTDMTHHFSTVNKIKGFRLAHKGQKGEEKSNYADEEAWQILHFILHLADISNQAKPLPLAIQWTDRCLDEFFLQGDEEKILGLPVSPLCDRTTTNRAESQIGFIKFVVQPAFEILGKIVPDVQTQILPILETNLQYWREQKQDTDVAALLEANELPIVEETQ